MSQVEVKVNYVLGFILAIQLLLCAVAAIGYSITRSRIEQNDTYIDWPDMRIALDSFLIFLTYFVLINTMIPISLIVTMEMVKLFQKYFIEKDRLMFSNYRKKNVSVQSASLNEELGQVEYVFTDKTGTLTMNIM
jgi:magnesium-transporting ATPase (P-type)